MNIRIPAKARVKKDELNIRRLDLLRKGVWAASDYYPQTEKDTIEECFFIIGQLMNHELELAKADLEEELKRLRALLEKKESKKPVQLELRAPPRPVLTPASERVIRRRRSSSPTEGMEQVKVNVPGGA